MLRFTLWVPAVVIGALLAAAPARADSLSLTFFSGSVYDANTEAMDTTLGLRGYLVDSFETTALIPGLTITFSGEVAPTTWASLPTLLEDTPFECNTGFGSGALDGAHVMTNNINNGCFQNGLASLTTFHYAPGTTVFGIGLSNFQSLDPSPLNPYPVTNHELFVNGVDLGVLETLAGANWTAGISRNGYLVIRDTGGLVSSVGFENLNPAPNGIRDFLVFDHLAVLPTDLEPVPEPASLSLLGLGLVGAVAARRRTRQRAAKLSA